VPDGPSLTVPVILTHRLRLEPLSLEHSAGMFAMWRAEAVCRYAGPAVDWQGAPIRLPAEVSADSDRIIAFFRHLAAAGRGFRWAVLLGKERQFIGAVGFNSLGPCSEIAYHLDPSAWGRGLMGEAVEAALTWLAQTGLATQVEAFIEPMNAPSRRLAQRRGFGPSGGVSGTAQRYVLHLPMNG
jgi:ribosomal-protein-alanine N-acetyltransferase